MIFFSFEQPQISGSERSRGGIKLWLYNPYKRAAGEHLKVSFSNSAKTVSQFNITLNFKVFMNSSFPQWLWQFAPKWKSMKSKRSFKRIIYSLCFCKLCPVQNVSIHLTIYSFTSKNITITDRWKFIMAMTKTTVLYWNVSRAGVQCGLVTMKVFWMVELTWTPWR